MKFHSFFNNKIKNVVECFRFSATVRLLVGSVLNIHMGAPKVYVSIVNETQANQLLSHARFGH